MNRIDEKLWPAMEPPPEFADALVERLLASDAVPAVRSRRGYRLAAILLAAVFVSGAAFGLSAGVKKFGTSRAERALPFVKTSNIPMQRRINYVTVPKGPQVIVSAMERATNKSIQAVPSSALPAVIPSASSAPPRVPACQCQRGFADMICDCY